MLTTKVIKFFQFSSSVDPFYHLANHRVNPETKKIPHALDEHEGNTLGFAEVLIPGTRQQVVNKGGDVADVDAAVLVAIGGCHINA